MGTQLTIDDLFKSEEVNKIVKKKKEEEKERPLTTDEHTLAGLLETVGLGKEKSILSTHHIMHRFNLTERAAVRKMILNIKKHSRYKFVIQGEFMVRNNKKVFVYYIPYANEVNNEDVNFQRWKTSTTAIVTNKPKTIELMYAHLNRLLKTVDQAVQNQIQIQYGDYKPHDIHRTAESYDKGVSK